MWTLTVLLLCVCATSRDFLVTADHTGDSKYATSGSTANTRDAGQFPTSDGASGSGSIGRGPLPSSQNRGSSGIADTTGGRFAPGAGVNVLGSNDRFRPAGATAFGASTGGNRFGQAGVGGPGFNLGGRGGAAAAGGTGAAFGSGQGATRVIEAPVTPTVTNTITIDHFVTLTDLAFHSVPVTLTDLVVRTTTLTTAQVIRTPVDDRVALQTTVVIRPTSMTVTCSKYYYNVVTDVSVDHVTITHTKYMIDQVTYTTTATQVSTYPSTMVRTIVHTQRTTVTHYHTITNTVHGQGGGYYY